MANSRLSPNTTNTTALPYISMAFFGAPASGKSNLVTRFRGESFKDKYDATIGVEFSVRHISIPAWSESNEAVAVKLQCWDLGGQERFSIVAGSYINGRDILAGCFDLSNPDSLNSVRKTLTRHKDHLTKNQTPIVFVGCKNDLTNTAIKDRIDIEFKALLEYLEENNFNVANTKYATTSSKDEDPTDALIQVLHPVLKSKQITSKLNAQMPKIVEAPEVLSAPEPTPFTRFKNFCKRHHVVRRALIATAILVGLALLVTGAVLTAGAVPLAFGVGASAITAFFTSTAIGSAILAGCGGAMGLFAACAVAAIAGLGTLITTGILCSVFPEKSKPSTVLSAPTTDKKDQSTPNNTDTGGTPVSTVLALNSMNSVSSVTQLPVTKATKAETSEGEILAVLPVTEKSDQTQAIRLSQSRDTTFSSSHSSEESEVSDYESKYKPGSNTAYSLD